MTQINIGCGLRKMSGYVNIDKSDYASPDLKLDLELGKLPFEDDSVEEIISWHILEHIQNIIPLMNECYRILKKGGRMSIIVPQNEGLDSDPDHRRRFSHLSWRYYCNYPLNNIYGITTHFKIIKNEFINNEDGGVLDVILEK